MTIYINGKYLTQRLTGVQRYAFEITKALVSLGASVRVLIPAALNTDKIDLPSDILIPLKGFKSTILWEQLTIAKFLRDKQDYLLLNLCNMGNLFNKNQLVCIHDVLYKVNPKGFTWAFRNYYRVMMPLIAKRAKRIITVSEFSKQEIARYLKVDPHRIQVVYNAPSSLFVCSDVEHIQQKKEDFFLFVGSMHPRKNLKLLVELFSRPAFRYEKLIVVGGKTKEFANENFDLPPNIVIRESCDDIQLARLYRHAKALLYPSFYEGFGLPMIEAMASGCPLVIADLAVFREVAVNGALYFDPYSLLSLETAVNDLKDQSPAEIMDTIHSNFLRSKVFTWENSAKILLDVIATSKY